MPVVIPRDGHYLVWDGQHRVWGLRELYGESEMCQCQVIPEDTPIEVLADLFLGRANTLPIRVIDKWMIRGHAKDATVLAVDAMLLRHNLRSGDQYVPGIVRAVGALEYIYSMNGGDVTLDRCLTVLHGAWGREPDAYDGTVMRGLGMFLHHFNGDVSDHDLTSRMMKAGGPARMLGQARDWAKVAGTSVTRAFCDKLVNLYNRGRAQKNCLVFGGARPEKDAKPKGH